MEILGIIPARGGSKGIPRKNIRILNGIPLIAHTITAAKKSKLITRLIVSTDDVEIKEIGERFGADVPFIRNHEYALDHIPNLPDLLVYTLNELRNTENYVPDIALVLEPTYPFRTAETIDEAITILSKSKSDWVATVSEVRENPYRMRILENNIIKPFINSNYMYSQRQDLPKVYMIRGAVYCTWAKRILEKNSLDGVWSSLIIDDIQAHDIDELIDLYVAEEIFRKKYENK